MKCCSIILHSYQWVRYNSFSQLIHCWKLKKRDTNLTWKKYQWLTAVFFITAIGTVRETGTMKKSRNTRVVSASKLIWAASSIVASMSRFVGTVSTVDGAVTNPRFYDTMTTVVTLKLTRMTLWYSGDFSTALRNL